MYEHTSGRLKANAAQLFYELYLLNDSDNQFTKHEKSLMGLGYMFLESNQLESLSLMSHELNSALASDVLRVMRKVVEEGLLKLLEVQDNVPCQRLEEYWHLSETLRVLKNK